MSQNSKDANFGEGDQGICIIAIFTAKDGMREEFVERASGILPHYRNEPGSISMELLVDAPFDGPLCTPVGPHSVVVIEKWQSISNAFINRSGPAFEAFYAAMAQMVVDKRFIVLRRT